MQIKNRHTLAYCVNRCTYHRKHLEARKFAGHVQCEPMLVFLTSCEGEGDSERKGMKENNNSPLAELYSYKHPVKTLSNKELWLTKFTQRPAN